MDAKHQDGEAFQLLVITTDNDIHVVCLCEVERRVHEPASQVCGHCAARKDREHLRGELRAVL
jgi:hypothetical protein